jgi:hypothetical protein
VDGGGCGEGTCRTIKVCATGSTGEDADVRSDADTPGDADTPRHDADTPRHDADTPRHDATPHQDAAPDDGGDSSGCGCRLASPRGASGALLLALLPALVVLGLRRRR